ncbi:DoxX family protein [Actinoplanes sp. NPDC051513]|uniref:DoxX family protein n=1 Tax=Actinoplanes sp. NPDC051513 TaxID=3363908 RepID=UPI00378DFABC
MFTVYAAVTIATILANFAVVVADLARAGFVLANMAEVGVPASALPMLAVLKAAGAAGLLLGLLGIDVIGIAAASGLVVFFVGAVVVHLRAGVLHNIAIPGTFLVLALASLTLGITH